MSISDRYFQPYREKITNMCQPHDPLDAIPYSSPFRRSFGSPKKKSPERYEFKHYYRDLSTTPTKKKLGRSIERSRLNHNKTEKMIKMDRQIHEPVWEHLYYRGLESKKQILQQHENQKDKIDVQCTFQPMIKKNYRYDMSGTSSFLERNNIWNENKIQKMVKQKEQEVNRDLQSCTFKPKINEYYKFKKNETKKKYINPSKSLTRLTKSRYEPHYQYLKHQKEPTYGKQESGKIKSILRREIQQIEL